MNHKRPAVRIYGNKHGALFIRRGLITQEEPDAQKGVCIKITYKSESLHVFARQQGQYMNIFTEGITNQNADLFKKLGVDQGLFSEYSSRVDLSVNAGVKLKVIPYPVNTN
ncbi:hypothetical protein [Flammeovirga sp. OC4]|uniref:hypothetical protein n=1 Tax=Flammeovirga sp. OC4 TaxID=1382345 RepID=UPI0005C48759|nr:hypothetical protein [Flammeovirga sp. OC4]